jgi:hypothetical protein
MLISRRMFRFIFPISHFCTTYQMIMTTRTISRFSHTISTRASPSPSS